MRCLLELRAHHGSSPFGTTRRQSFRKRTGRRTKPVTARATRQNLSNEADEKPCRASHARPSQCLLADAPVARGRNAAIALAAAPARGGARCRRSDAAKATRAPPPAA